MKQSRTVFVAAFTIVAVFAVDSAQAIPIIFTDRASWDAAVLAGISNAEIRKEDFNGQPLTPGSYGDVGYGLPAGATVLNPDLSMTLNDVGNGGSQTGIVPAGEHDGTQALRLRVVPDSSDIIPNVLLGEGCESIDFNFTGPTVFAFGIEFETATTHDGVRLQVNGVNIDVANHYPETSTNDGDGFLGIIDIDGIASIRMIPDDEDPVFAGEEFEIDEFEYAIEGPDPNDTTPPSCRLTAFNPGPPTSIEVTFQDGESGLSAINVLVANNAIVVIPPFAPGTTDPVTIVATKIDQAQSAQVIVEAFDVDGNRVVCDPVTFELAVAPGETVEYVVTDIPEIEGWVTVYNETPGFERLSVDVNGLSTYTINNLQPGEIRTISVFPHMVAGANTMTFISNDGVGGLATILISDVPPPSPSANTPLFVRGDSNTDGVVDLSDSIHLLDALFVNRRPFDCTDASDANDDGNTDVSDAVYVLNYLFVGTAQPPAPYPECGGDASADAHGCGKNEACF